MAEIANKNFTAPLSTPSRKIAYIVNLLQLNPLFNGVILLFVLRHLMKMQQHNESLWKKLSIAENRNAFICNLVHAIHMT